MKAIRISEEGFNDITMVSEDTFLVEKNGKRQILKNEKIAEIPSDYEQIYDLKNGFFKIKVKDDGFYLMNYDLEKISEIVDNIKHLEGYLFIFQKNKKWNIFDSEKKLVTTPSFDSIEETGRPGVFLVKNNQLYGLIDKNGETILSIENQSIKYTGDDYFITKNSALNLGLVKLIGSSER